jgi:hypothetical protein
MTAIKVIFGIIFWALLIGAIFGGVSWWFLVALCVVGVLIHLFMRLR